MAISHVIQTRTINYPLCSQYQRNETCKNDTITRDKSRPASWSLFNHCVIKLFLFCKAGFPCYCGALVHRDPYAFVACIQHNATQETLL